MYTAMSLLRRSLFTFSLIILLGACARKAATYEFPRPVDTSTQPIRAAESRNWLLSNGVTVSTDFLSGRLHELRLTPGGVISASVLPENEPINKSPWYAFTLEALTATPVKVALNYPEWAGHRYWPKYSTDRINWVRLDSTRIELSPDGRVATLSIDLSAGEKVWIAAQEIHDSKDVSNWAKRQAAHVHTEYTTVGKSVQGRPLIRLTVKKADARPRKTIAILSRQHPPEVTGYLAMQAFVEALLDDDRLGGFLDDYQLLIYPLLNPDGVDGGHWRHNAGGVDLNRDWAYYRQPENEQIANDIVRTARKTKAPLVLGLDFHSTQEDVYYTHDDSVQPVSALGNFKDRWLAAIETKIKAAGYPDFSINEEAEPVGRPTSMSWFRTQFNAEGITYEIGDGTPRDFVRQKGVISAEALLTELLGREAK